MSFNKHACQVTSPIAANPAKALFQILRAVFESGLYFTRFVILHGDLPAMRIHPTSDKVVVVSIELESSPCLVCEAMGKSIVLQDTCTIRDGPARKTR